MSALQVLTWCCKTPGVSV